MALSFGCNPEEDTFTCNFEFNDSLCEMKLIDT